MSALVSGRGRASGNARGVILRTRLAFSFVDDVDVGTGVVKNSSSDIFGETLYGRVLVIPQSREKGFGPEVLRRLAGYRGAPAAILAEEADDMLVEACMAAQIPLIDQLDLEAFRTGDEVKVDAENGTVELVNVLLSRVATSVVFNSRGELLVVQRSGRVGSHRGSWSCISGYMEEGEEPRDTAFRELREETGLGEEDLVLLGCAETLDARSNNDLWRVHPCAFKKKSEKAVVLDWEAQQHKWVTPEEVEEMERKGVAVPRLYEVVKRARAFL
ncbi:MAG: NUDIX domain-containing protein [Candidatus Thermoplasmatota archaeon]|nr:NUDIX domain-containing protein [Candidatus Thermoplasmatota archaeon]